MKIEEKWAEYHYSEGRLKSIDYSSGEYCVYSYNDAGQITAIEVIWNNELYGGEYYVYDSLGRLVHEY